jgi:hypothetical protein
VKKVGGVDCMLKGTRRDALCGSAQKLGSHVPTCVGVAGVARSR